MLAAVADGIVWAVTDQHSGAVRGYVQLCPPEPIARLDAALQFASRRSRTGRARLRDLMPAEAEARP